MIVGFAPVKVGHRQAHYTKPRIAPMRGFFNARSKRTPERYFRNVSSDSETLKNNSRRPTNGRSCFADVPSAARYQKTTPAERRAEAPLQSDEGSEQKLPCRTTHKSNTHKKPCNTAGCRTCR